MTQSEKEKFTGLARSWAIHAIEARNHKAYAIAATYKRCADDLARELNKGTEQ